MNLNHFIIFFENFLLFYLCHFTIIQYINEQNLFETRYINKLLYGKIILVIYMKKQLNL